MARNLLSLVEELVTCCLSTRLITYCLSLRCPFERIAKHMSDFEDNGDFRAPKPDLNYCTGMCSGSKEGSYFRLMDLCITQL